MTTKKLISDADYDYKLREQGFRCGICDKHLSHSKKYFAIDHDHETGKIRGLLCTNCNLGLGMFRDNPRYLAKALLYLEKYGKTF